jgi:hypothetical protein
MFSKRRLFLFFTAFLFVGPTAVAGVKKIETYVVRAPSIDMEGIRTISVDIRGDQGAVLKSAIFDLTKDDQIGKERSWFSGKIKDKPNFEPSVDLITLSVVTQGADARLSGSASGNSRDTVETERKTDREGNQYTVWCVKRTATLSYEVAMTVGNDLRMQKADSDQIGDSSCSRKSSTDAKAGVASPQRMIEVLGKRLAVRILAEIRPIWRVQVFKLHNDRSTKKANKRIYKKKDLAGGLSMLMELVESDPYNFSGLHNAAVANEMAGHLSKALELIAKACNLGEEAELCAETQQRIIARDSDADLLHTLGLRIRGRAGAASNGPIAATRKIKGSKKKRIVVFTAAGEDGEVLTQVPGGLRVQVVGEEGEYLKIRLPDGAMGYVLSDQVK